MPGTEHRGTKRPGDRNYIRETIEQPPRPERKPGRLIVLALILGILFGLTAGLTFALSAPWFQKLWGGRNPKLESVDILRDTVSSSEDSVTEDGETDTEPEETEETLTDSQIETVQRIWQVSDNLKNSMVTVTSQSEQEDVFSQTYTHQQVSCGLIIAVTASDIRILTESSLLEEADSVHISLQGGQTGEASLLGIDHTTGIAVVSLPITELPEHVTERLEPINLGNSYLASMGEMVVALGKPQGEFPSVCWGIVSYIEKNVQGTDFILQLLHTDIIGERDAGGVLVDVRGAVIGWIAAKLNEDGTNQHLIAYSISDLKGILENLSNGKHVSRLGVRVQEVTASVSRQRDLPRGLFVTEVVDASPALRAEIRNGDILVRLDDREIRSASDLQSFLMSKLPGTAVKAVVMREGREGYSEQTFDVTLDER